MSNIVLGIVIGIGFVAYTGIVLLVGANLAAESIERDE